MPACKSIFTNVSNDLSRDTLVNPQVLPPLGGLRCGCANFYSKTNILWETIYLYITALKFMDGKSFKHYGKGVEVM